MARDRDVTAYVVCSNLTLESLVAAQPDSFDALLAIPGIGPEKLERYGSELLGAIIAYRTARAPSRAR